MTNQDTQTKSAGETTTATYESFINALNGLQSEGELRDALRELVKRGAATARSRGSDLHAETTKATGAIENVLVKAVNGVAETNRKIADAALQDIETACSSLEKLAGAKSFEEAYRAYADYLHHQNEVGVARAKSTAAYVSAKTSEAFDAVRDSATKLVPWLKAA
jgi:hypothetical protein